MARLLEASTTRRAAAPGTLRAGMQPMHCEDHLTLCGSVPQEQVPELVFLLGLTRNDAPHTFAVRS